MLKSWNIQKVPKYHGILVGSSMYFYSVNEPFLWTSFVAKSWGFIVAKKGYADNLMVWLIIHFRPRFIQAISLSINEYVQRGRGGHAYSVVLVQAGMFDWHQTLNVHYSALRDLLSLILFIHFSNGLVLQRPFLHLPHCKLRQCYPVVSVSAIQLSITT